MSKKLKVGLIGLGGIANLHAGGWAASEHAELVAGCTSTLMFLSAGKPNTASQI